MTDCALEKYIAKYGDRVAAMAFSKRLLQSEPSPTKQTLLRQRLQEKVKVLGGNARAAGRPPGKMKASAISTENNCKGVELAWKNLNFGATKHKHMNITQGGGTHMFIVPFDTKIEDLYMKARNIFFDSDPQSKACEDFFEIELNLRDCSHRIVESDSTLMDIYQRTGLRLVRLYICSKQKEFISKKVVKKSTISGTRPVSIYTCFTSHSP